MRQAKSFRRGIPAAHIEACASIVRLQVIRDSGVGAESAGIGIREVERVIAGQGEKLRGRTLRLPSADSDGKIPPD